jgi:hypothetical protein
MAGLFSKATIASGAPERFAFRQRANVAQAFGHDAAGLRTAGISGGELTKIGEFVKKLGDTLQKIYSQAAFSFLW